MQSYGRAASAPPSWKEGVQPLSQNPWHHSRYKNSILTSRRCHCQCQFARRVETKAPCRRKHSEHATWGTVLDKDLLRRPQHCLSQDNEGSCPASCEGPGCASARLFLVSKPPCNVRLVGCQMLIHPAAIEQPADVRIVSSKSLWTACASLDESSATENSTHHVTTHAVLRENTAPSLS
ncbi:hypothetical protein LY78DRAFT_285661 [Colletotrichum sublineola]|nr:hypothetical protein LY78DRAFT_285661 [Colletotrichum sublineola]